MITGGAGFIGSHLAEALLARGDAVSIIDNFDNFYDQRAKQENLQLIRQYDSFFLHTIDLCNRDDLERR